MVALWQRGLGNGVDVRSLPIHHDYFRRHFRFALSGSEAYGRWRVLDNAVMDLVGAAGMDLPFGPLPADEKMAVVGDAYFRMSMVDKYTLGDLEQNRRRCAQAQDRARHFNFPKHSEAGRQSREQLACGTRVIASVTMPFLPIDAPSPWNGILHDKVRHDTFKVEATVCVAGVCDPSGCVAEQNRGLPELRLRTDGGLTWAPAWTARNWFYTRRGRCRRS